MNASMLLALQTNYFYVDAGVVVVADIAAAGCCYELLFGNYTHNPFSSS